MNTRLIRSPFRPGEERVATATAIEALSWVWTKYEDRCCVLASMQDAVVIDLAMQVDRRFPIVFLDTGYHFDETWETVRAVERAYGIEVEVIGPLSAPKPEIQPGECCNDKPRLLDRALEHRDAWVSGIRRAQTTNRSDAPVIDQDRAGRTKVNPLVQWSDADRDRFIASRDLPRNPLLRQGYLSVGCEPCTSPPVEAADPRSGRWAGSERTECGLHL